MLANWIEGYMHLTKSHMTICILLGIIAMLLGFIIAQYNALYEWKLAGSQCAFNSDDQTEMIKGFLRW